MLKDTLIIIAVMFILVITLYYITPDEVYFKINDCVKWQEWQRDNNYVMSDKQINECNELITNNKIYE